MNYKVFQRSREAIKSPRSKPSASEIVVLLAGLCLLVGAIARVIAVQPLTHVSMVHWPFADDGFYYLEIARNVARLGKFTFDGINRTNGFHPLWQLLLAIIAHFSVDDFIFMRLVMYFGIALFVLTGILLFKLVTSYGGQVAGLASVVIWSLAPDLIKWQNKGMENTIYLPLLILALLSIERFVKHPSSLREAAFLGVVFGLLMWSRSDSVLFVILALTAIVIYLKTKSWPIPTIQIRVLVVVVGLTLLFGTGYLVFNYYAAGSFQSVSGVVKIGASVNSSWDLRQTIDALNVHLSMVWDLVADIGGLTWWALNWRILAFQVMFFTWLTVSTAWWGFHLSKKFRSSFPRASQDANIGGRLLLLYTLIHTIILVTLLRRILGWTSWYIVPQILTVLVVVPVVLFPRLMIEYDLPKLKKHVTERFPKSRFGKEKQINWQIVYQVSEVLIFTIVVLGPCTWVISVPINKWFQHIANSKTTIPGYELATWLNDNVSPSARVGMFDAGVTGYFAHSHVINLDGLVNSPEYVSVRRTGSYASYIMVNKFEYIIMYYIPGTDKHQLRFRPPTDDSIVCHRLMHINKNPSAWGPEQFDNFFEVVALRYDGMCEEPWEPGFPLTAVPPK